MAATSGCVSFRMEAVESIGTGLATGSLTHRLAYELGFGAGTTDGNIDRIYSASGTLSSSASVTIDLRSITDQDGTSETVAEIVAIGLANTGTTTLHAGNAASNGTTFFATDATNLIPLRPGQRNFYVVNGGAATSASDKDLKILNTSGSTSGSYSLILFGRSA